MDELRRFSGVGSIRQLGDAPPWALDEIYEYLYIRPWRTRQSSGSDLRVTTSGASPQRPVAGPGFSCTERRRDLSQMTGDRFPALAWGSRNTCACRTRAQGVLHRDVRGADLRHPRLRKANAEDSQTRLGIGEEPPARADSDTAREGERVDSP